MHYPLELKLGALHFLQSFYNPYIYSSWSKGYLLESTHSTSLGILTSCNDSLYCALVEQVLLQNYPDSQSKTVQICGTEAQENLLI
jgi:hypothetical protein